MGNDAYNWYRTSDTAAPVRTVKDKLDEFNIVGDPGHLGQLLQDNPPKSADTTPLNDVNKSAGDLANELSLQRQYYGKTEPVPLPPNPGDLPPDGANYAQWKAAKDAYDAAVAENNRRAAGGAPSYSDQTPTVNRTNIDPLFRAQQLNLGSLANAAAGKTPSAAELQLKQEADRAAAQQYGLAAALQGGMSAGGALRQASVGSANVLGQANAQAGVLRAQEQATAREQLTAALNATRAQEQEVALADQRSKLQAMGLDEHHIDALLMAQLQSMGISAQVAAALVSASAAKAAGQNANDLQRQKMAFDTFSMIGGGIGGGGGGAGSDTSGNYGGYIGG